MFKNKEQIFLFIITILISSFVTFIISLALNISKTGQTKLGGLILNTGGAPIGLIVENGKVGIGTRNPSYKLDIVGVLRLQPTSSPTGANGVIYYDSTVNKFKCFENGVWKDCVSAGGLPSGAYIAFPDANPRTGFTYTGIIETLGGNTWTTKAPMLTARAGLAAAVVNNIIYAIGGYNGRELSTNEAYDPSTNTWTTKRSMLTARQEFAVAVVNNIIYAIGGWNNGYLSTNEAYNPSTDTWTTKAPMLTAREGLAAAVVNNIIYAIGGFNGSYLSINEAYNPSTNTWTTKARMPTAREDIAAAVVNNIIYVIGGEVGYNPRVFTSANEAYDPSTNSWTTKAPMPTARDSLAIAVVNNIIYAIGGWGYDSSNLSTNEAYDPSTNSWTNKIPMPTGRKGLAAAVVNNIIYTIGGYNASGYLSTNEAYNTGLTVYWFQKQ
jgi:N-acetylneuraminic acid mutarotase